MRHCAGKEPDDIFADYNRDCEHFDAENALRLPRRSITSWKIRAWHNKGFVRLVFIDTNGYRHAKVSLPLPKVVSQEDALAGLRRSHSPAWIIDPAAAYVIASNAAGRAFLGLDGAGPTAPLDFDMPALYRFRDIARGIEPGIAAARPFEFWTPQGPRTLECEVRIVHAPGRPPAVFVSATNANSDFADRKSAVDEPDPPMDDAAKLREIARRIRAGSKTLTLPAGDPDMTQTARAAARNSATAVFGDMIADTADDPVSIEEYGAVREPPCELSERLSSGLPSETIAKLAHELKTPLSAIAAAAEIMKDERLGRIENERYRGYAKDIHDGARHALSVIERLLGSGAGSEDERPGLAFASVDLNAVAESCVSIMLPLAEKKGLALTGDYALHLPRVTADLTSLKQILLNLLTNSVKFTNAGGSVTIATRCDSGGPVRIEVADTGPGMSQAEIAHALDPVRPVTGAPRQTDGTSSELSGGMGLGLPLVRSLVEANAGRLEIDSASGKGTRVVVSFQRNRLIPV